MKLPAFTDRIFIPYTVIIDIAQEMNIPNSELKTLETAFKKFTLHRIRAAAPILETHKEAKEFMRNYYKNMTIMNTEFFNALINSARDIEAAEALVDLSQHADQGNGVSTIKNNLPEFS